MEVIYAAAIARGYTLEQLEQIQRRNAMAEEKTIRKFIRGSKYDDK